MAIDVKRGTHGQTSSPTTGRRRRWQLLAALAALAIVVWLLPGIVAHTPLLGWAVNAAAADLGGTVTIRSASLGWLSPVAVQSVEVKDAEGKTVLALPAASSGRTLAALLWNPKNLGRFRLENPKLTLVLRDNGSNLEDLLAKYLVKKGSKEAEKTSPTKIGLSLEVIGGGLSVVDQGTGQCWQAENLTVNFRLPAGADGPMTVKVSTDLPDARHPGKFLIEMKATADKGEVAFSATRVPLAMFRALAARFAPAATCTGWLAADVRASWSNEKAGKNSVRADFRVEDFSLAAPALESDVLRLDRLRAVCQMSWRADRLEIEKSSVTCDLGNVSLTGTIPLVLLPKSFCNRLTPPHCNEGGESAGTNVLESTPTKPLLAVQGSISGRVDLARLARLLPATLRLRRQLRIDSGQLQWVFSSWPEPQGMTWHGRLEAAELSATAGGRRIVWQRPILVAFDAHEGPGGPIVDDLRCESDFLEIHAAGTPDELAASLTFNLKQLADQLGQFVDLGGLRLAGEGTGRLDWRRSSQQRFNAGAKLQLRDFQLAAPNRQPWREESLLVFLSADGQTDLGANTRIDAAALSVKAGADQIDVKLTQPVKDFRGGGSWPVQVRMQGQLHNWPTRLAAWLPTGDWRLVGGYVFEAEGTVSSDGVELRGAMFSAVPLTAATAWLNLNEPRVDASVAGRWNQRRRRLQIELASLTSATVGIQANNVVVALPQSGPMELAGTLQYQGDVGRIRQWFADPNKSPTWRLAGQLSGSAVLRQVAGVVHGETTAELTNLAVVDASGQQFQEPKITLAASGDYDCKSRVFKLEQFELASSVLAAGIAGRVAPVSGQNNAQLDGQVRYDLERLAGLMRPYLGSGVRIVGSGTSPAWYRGPFSLATGSAAAGFKWDWANVYGFQVGPSELKAAMADGAVRVEPLDLAVSQGRMHLAPRVRLVPDPIELTLPKGPLAQQIQIDPGMCTAMLKYVAPVLAGVTSARGTFSIELDRCRIPLGDPAKGDLAGRLIIHSVAIGPGPLVRELAIFLGRETPAQLRRESVVPFQLADGRVYHKDLELLFPDLTIRTRGSVGLDQTLKILAEMPVPPKWLANNPLVSQALRNQTISIPIDGTLGKPRLDPKAMRDLTRQFLQNAAGNLLEEELNRLFRPRK